MRRPKIDPKQLGIDCRDIHITITLWKYWVAVKEIKFSYHSPETILFTIYP